MTRRWFLIPFTILLASGCSSREDSPSPPIALYAASYSGGVYHSANGGSNWVEVGWDEPPPSCFVKRLVKGPGGSLLVATSGSGLYRAEGNGFRRLPFPGMGEISALLVTGGTSPSLWAGTLGNGVFESRDAGESWIARIDGLEYQRVTDLSQAPAGSSGLLCATEGGLFRLVDGKEWHWITRELGAWDARCVAVEQGGGGRAFAGGAGIGGSPPFISLAPEDSIRSCGGRGLPHGNAFDLVVEEGPTQTTLFLATSGGVFASTDGGDRWRGFGDGGPEDEVFSLVVTEGYVFAGGTEGVYRCDRESGEWRRVSRGLPRSAVTSLLAAAD